MSVAQFVLASALVVGCAGAQAASPATGHDPAVAATAAVKAPGEAAVSDTSTCPVTGETFKIEATSAKAEYQGKTYYFCCPGCKGKFEANPAKFVKHSS